MDQSRVRYLSPRSHPFLSEMLLTPEHDTRADPENVSAVPAVTEPLASIVVAVKSDVRVRRLLESLMLQTLPIDQYEVIVVENGSQELADLDGHGGVVRYFHRPQANSAAARNVGLSCARGRYLLLTDADCVVGSDWVEQITGALVRSDAAVVGGAIRPYRPRTWTQRYAMTIVDGQSTLSYLPALHLPYVVGANAGFETDHLRDIGGFDEELRSGNDVDVCYKLGLRGRAIELVPAAIVWHEDRATLIAHFQRFRNYAVFQVLLFAKYKNISGKRCVFDRYPIARTCEALRSVPYGVTRLLLGDSGPAIRGFLQVVEAAGVLVGEIQGSIKYRQLYI